MKALPVCSGRHKQNTMSVPPLDAIVISRLKNQHAAAESQFRFFGQELLESRIGIDPPLMKSIGSNLSLKKPETATSLVHIITEIREDLLDLDVQRLCRHLPVVLQEVGAPAPQRDGGPGFISDVGEVGFTRQRSHNPRHI